MKVRRFTKILSAVNQGVRTELSIILTIIDIMVKTNYLRFLKINFKTIKRVQKPNKRPIE